MDKLNASELYQRQLMAKLVAAHHKCLHGFMNKRYVRQETRMLQNPHNSPVSDISNNIAPSDIFFNISV